MADQENARGIALRRLKAKRDFRMHLGAYLIVNAMLVAIWALTSRAGAWPIWVIVFWGVGLAFHGWSAYFNQPFSEDDIRKEMDDPQ